MLLQRISIIGPQFVFRHFDLVFAQLFANLGQRGLIISPLRLAQSTIPLFGGQAIFAGDPLVLADDRSVVAEMVPVKPFDRLRRRFAFVAVDQRDELPLAIQHQ